MLRYLEGLQGNQRKLALKKAKDMIKEKEPIKDEGNVVNCLIVGWPVI